MTYFDRVLWLIHWIEVVAFHGFVLATAVFTVAFASYAGRDFARLRGKSKPPGDA